MKVHHILAAVLLSVAFAAPLSVKAADTSSTATASATPKAKAKAIAPISGKVAAVDKEKKTFTVGKTVFAVTDGTTFTGVTFDTLEGATVTVKYTKSGDTNTATSVKVKAEKTPKAKASPKASAS
jgi:hypothetical protein